MTACVVLAVCLLAATVARAEPSESEPPPNAGNAAPTAAPTPHAKPRVSTAELRAALARYRQEPTAGEVVRAALDAMREAPTDGMASRARIAGWIPTVGLSARRGQAVDLSSPSQTTGDDALRLSTDEDLTLTASLTFELDRVLFRREETSIAREARAERDARDERVREVVRLYFLRRRLQLERDLGAGDPAEHAVRIAETEALLDAFTAGAFGRMIRASESRPDGQPPRTQTLRGRGLGGARDRR